MVGRLLARTPHGSTSEAASGCTVEWVTMITFLKLIKSTEQALSTHMHVYTLPCLLAKNGGMVLATPYSQRASCFHTPANKLAPTRNSQPSALLTAFDLSALAGQPGGPARLSRTDGTVRTLFTFFTGGLGHW